MHWYIIEEFVIILQDLMNFWKKANDDVIIIIFTKKITVVVAA